MKFVSIIMGSKSDYEVVYEAAFKRIRRGVRDDRIFRAPKPCSYG